MPIRNPVASRGRQNGKGRCLWRRVGPFLRGLAKCTHCTSRIANNRESSATFSLAGTAAIPAASWSYPRAGQTPGYNYSRALSFRLNINNVFDSEGVMTWRGWGNFK